MDSPLRHDADHASPTARCQQVVRTLPLSDFA
jgi:hypothetical protein